MMRSSGYARTPPEAPENSAVLVVRLVVVIMARELMGQLDRRQRLFGQKFGLNAVEQDAVVTR
jgi:hypothetical protein